MAVCAIASRADKDLILASKKSQGQTPTTSIKETTNFLHQQSVMRF
jgi:hypothetical protein